MLDWIHGPKSSTYHPFDDHTKSGVFYRAAFLLTRSKGWLIEKHNYLLPKFPHLKTIPLIYLWSEGWKPFQIELVGINRIH
jgi:hypothetical protein